jgi:hypothetical protein
MDVQPFITLASCAMCCDALRRQLVCCALLPCADQGAVDILAAMEGNFMACFALIDAGALPGMEKLDWAH